MTELPTKQAFFGYEIAESLRHEISEFFFEIAEDNTQPHLSQDAANIVATLLDIAMDAFYHDVVANIRVHPATRKTADKGINTVSRGAHLVIRKMVNSLEPDELEIFAIYLDSLLLDTNERHFVAFGLDEELIGEIEQMIIRIRDDDQTDTYNRLIVKALCELTDVAAFYCYYKPTKLFRVRPFVKKSADLGIKTVIKGIHFVIRQMFKTTRQKELIEFSLMLEKQLIYIETKPST